MEYVNTREPMTSARCRQAIQALAREYPFLSTCTLGLSPYGRPLTAVKLGQGQRQVLYSAAHHGNEWITTPVLLLFLQDLCRAYAAEGPLYGVPARTILSAATIHLVPMVDPDGVDLVTGALGPEDPGYDEARQIGERYPSIPFPKGWKANLKGVDLNLQYPAGWLQARQIKFSQGYTGPAPRDYVGRYPLSQPETIALARYTQDVNPDLVLAYHTQGKVIYWQYRDFRIPGAEALAREFARLSGYQAQQTPYASGFAGYKDWFIQSFRRPGFTIECGLGENPLPLTQLPEIYRDNLGILVTAALGLAEADTGETELPS